MDQFLQTLVQLPDMLIRVEAQLEASASALNETREMLGNTRMYEKDAADYMGVDTKTMYNYRQKGLNYEKVGRIISYYRKDLDAWRKAGAVALSKA